MADITKCDGRLGPKDMCHDRHSCLRYTAATGHWQVWFVAAPRNNGVCEMFLENDNVRTGDRFGDNNKESDKQSGTSDVAGQPDSADGAEAS